MRRKRWYKVVSLLTFAVVFCTVYALIFPAATLERSTEPICMLDEHTHSAECNKTEMILVCNLEENEEHQHTEDCYKTEETLVCDISEHVHNDSCYPFENVVVSDIDEQEQPEVLKEPESMALGEPEKVQVQEPEAAEEPQSLPEEETEAAEKPGAVEQPQSLPEEETEATEESQATEELKDADQNEQIEKPVAKVQSVTLAASESGNQIETASDFAKLEKGGKFYLKSNISISKTVAVTRDTILDLNGHRISVTASALFNVTGGSLTITDSSQGKITVVTPGNSLYGNRGEYSDGVLTYYVTETRVTDELAGATSETVKKYTVSDAGMIIGRSDSRAMIITGGTVNLEGGYMANFKRGNTENGGAIQVTGGVLNVGKGFVITGNEAGRGGAIFAGQGAAVNINGGVISGNTSKDGPANFDNTRSGGGGIYAGSGSTVNLNSGYITGNVASSTGYFDGGGGILVQSAEVNIHGGYITGNTASGGGGIKTWRRDSGVINMDGGFITANRSVSAEAGGVNVDANGILTISQGHITNNIAGKGTDDESFQHWGGGGLFCCDSNAAIKLTNALITGNKAGGFGGGVAGCSTGRVQIVMEDGAGIFENTAAGSHTSGNLSTKNDDNVYAKNDPVFMQNGYQDYYCALTSSVTGGMLGNGTSNWSGSADGVAVASASKTDIINGAYITGLSAAPSASDIANAENAACVYINGNESPTHGGGILANGYLFIGRADEIESYCRLELEAKKQLVDQNDSPLSLGDHKFSFVVIDENGEEVSRGTNDSKGAVSFDRRLPFKEAGTFTYFVYEEQPEGSDGIIPDSRRYKMEVSVQRKDNGVIAGAHKISYEFTNVKISDEDSGKVLYNKNPGNNETHSVIINPTGGRNFVNRKIDKISVTVKKEWRGDQPGADKIEVTLMEDGQKCTAQGMTNPVVLSSENGWTYTWSNLDAKKSYTVSEKKVRGYLPKYETHFDNTDKTLKIINIPIEEVDFRINIKKVDAENTSKVLSDAEFEISDEKGTKLKFSRNEADGKYSYADNPHDDAAESRLVTGEDGIIRIEGIPGGIYTLTETKAPKGYTEAEAVTIRLDEETPEQTLDITVKDAEFVYELPETGGNGTVLFTSTGLLLISIGIGLLIVKPKRRKEDNQDAA